MHFRMNSLRSPVTTALRQIQRRATPASRSSVFVSNHVQRASYASAKDRSAGPPLTNPLNIPKWFESKPLTRCSSTNSPSSQARNKLPPPQTTRQQPPNLQRPFNSHDRRRPQRADRLPYQLHARVLLPAQRSHAFKDNRTHNQRVPRHLHKRRRAVSAPWQRTAQPCPLCGYSRRGN